MVMDTLDARLHRIGQHHFRAKFRLRGRDRAVVDLRGIATVHRHAEELIRPARTAAGGSPDPFQDSHVRRQCFREPDRPAATNHSHCVSRTVPTFGELYGVI